MDAARQVAFDGNLYLRQLSLSRQRRAAHNPLLHYCLVGWRESRSPSARFDPIYFSGQNPGLAGNPLLALHYLNSDIPQNDIEALGRDPGVRASRKGTILVFHHSRGGGSTKCLGLFEENLIDDGFMPIRLRLLAKSDRLIVLQTSDRTEVHDLIDGFVQFLISVKRLSPVRILISHVVDIHPQLVFQILTRLLDELSCPVDILLHDYIAVCSRINLVNEKQQTCFVVPDAERCRRCVASQGSDVGTVDPGQWRRGFCRFC